MCQNNYNTASSKGKHLTLDDRKIIAHLYNYQNKSYKEIGEEVNFHRTTISREIDKGKITLKRTQDSYKEVYDYEIAQQVHVNNATAKGPNLKIDKNHEIAQFIEKKVEERYSPQVIAELIKKDDRFEMYLSYKTIYNYIDMGVLMVDREDLVYGNYSNDSNKKRKESTKTKQHNTKRAEP